MSRRNLAAKGRQDSNHKAIAEAIEALGYPCMDLSAAGNGVEDLLVGLSWTEETPPPLWGRFWRHAWLCVECKVPPIKYTVAQKAWRAATPFLPRITVVSGQDAVDQIRALTS